MRVSLFRRIRMGVAAGLVVLSLLNVQGAGAASVAPAGQWEPGVVVLTLFPSIPDPQSTIDLINQVIADPGGAIEDNTAGVRDFLRVCGGAGGSGEIVVARLPSEDAAAKAAALLTDVPGVASVQRNHLVQAHGHTDPEPGGDLFGRQWALHNTGQEVGYYHYDATPGQDIRWMDARERATGEGTVIAILDEGVDISHPDLAPNVWVNEGETAGDGVDNDGNGWVDDVHGWNYVDNGGQPRPDYHSTAVAGIAAAADDGVGITGVAPQAQIMSVGFIDGVDPRSVTELRALGAFAYAIANGADVINNSWGLYAPVGIGSPLMTEAMRCAERHDIVVAWSGGNTSAVPDWPSAYPSPVSLRSGSFDAKGCPALGMQFVPAFVDVMAPGVDVLTTASWDDTYTGFSGTSAASPHTAGVAALVRQLHPELSAAEVVTAVKAGARREFMEPWSSSLGWLSAAGALDAAGSGATVAPPSLDGDLEQSSLHRCWAGPIVKGYTGMVEAVKDMVGL